jgi:hypothetical protein
VFSWNEGDHFGKKQINEWGCKLELIKRQLTLQSLCEEIIMATFNNLPIIAAKVSSSTALSRKVINRLNRLPPSNEVKAEQASRL